MMVKRGRDMGGEWTVEQDRRNNCGSHTADISNDDGNLLFCSQSPLPRLVSVTPEQENAQ